MSDNLPAEPTSRERAPGHSLPSWAECKTLVARGKATPLQRFIYEYDDADSYRSEWFMHRLELALDAVAQSAKLEALEKAEPQLLKHGFVGVLSGETGKTLWMCRECKGEGPHGEVSKDRVQHEPDCELASAIRKLKEEA